MPLYWKIDSRQKLVTLWGEGGVTRAELDAYIDAVVGGGALPYRKLFDGTNAHAAMSADEMMALAVRFRSYHHLPMGPLAIVLPGGWTAVLARVLGILATGKRPMRIFSNLKAAQKWIDNLADVEPEPSREPVTGDPAPPS